MKNPDFKKMENIFLFNEIFNRQPILNLLTKAAA